MNVEDLWNLARAGESAAVEFKRSTGQRTDAAKTVCGMLNGDGGVVLFGVSDTGEVVGQQVTAHTQEEVVQELRKIDPSVQPRFEVIGIANDLSVLALHVQASPAVHTYDGRPFVRQGPTTSLMPRDLFEQRIVERMHPQRRWELELLPEDMGVGDLDEREVMRTVENAVRLGRLDADVERDVKSALRGLGLLSGARLTNAAVALYGQSDRARALYPQLQIRLARFRGTDRLSDFSDNRQIWGHSFELLRRAEAFLLDHVPIAGRVLPGRIEREDRPKYPPRATREALANALCHRDYGIAGGAVTVAMYDDRLEIGNPGQLHFGLTPEKLLAPHESRPWNPLIAGVFFRAGVIEQWGTGTLNIARWCQEFEAPAPRWDERDRMVTVCLQPAPWFEAARSSSRGAESEAESGAESLRKRALNELKAGALAKSELAARLGLPSVTGALNRAIRALLAEGAIELTVPERPNSRLQKYRIRGVGRVQASPSSRTGPEHGTER